MYRKVPVNNFKAGRGATQSPTLKEIAWAAGIFEGEGSATAARKSYNSIQVNVTQKDHWLLDRFKALFGGNVYHLKSQVCGRWECSGTRARGFSYTIYPFLSPRRKAQIRRALGKAG